MPAPIPLALRHQIVEQHLRGTPLSTLAHELGYCEAAVRRIYQRYRRGGLDRLAPDYHNCGAPTHHAAPLIVRAACWLKRLHPAWGAPFIRLLLMARYGDDLVPTARTLQRWFKQRGLQPSRSRTPRPSRAWAERVHEVWQVDANERLKLTNGQPACYLSVVDEKSGSLLSAGVFPLQPDRSGHPAGDAGPSGGAL